MKWRRLVVLLGILTLWPTGAYAAAGWWAWLEELSGPGPFHGSVYSGAVLCERDGKLVSCWPPTNPKRLVVLSVGWLDSGDNVRFKDEQNTPDRRKVNVFQMSGLYMFRLHPALDAGFGAGLMRFSGEGFDSLLRWTLIPASFSFRPLAVADSLKERWFAHFVRLELETSFVTEGFTAEQFGNSTSKFTAGRELLTRGAVVFDLGSIIWNPKVYGR
jgi:hypothetical protein